MFTPPQPPRTRLSVASFVLLLLIIGAGAGLVYLFTVDETPSWMSFLLPSTSYRPSEAEKKEAGKPENNDKQTASVARAPSRNAAASPPTPSKAVRPPSATEATAGSAPSSPASEGAEIPSSPVITYGKAQQADASSSVVRGQIPDAQGVSGLAPANMPATPAGPTKSDKVVTPALIEDMARFLTTNFWPVGSHPLARDKAITTATVKWANIKYGNLQVQSFGATGANATAKRKGVLDYVFTPVTINLLYHTYAQHFFDAFDREARAQTKTPDKKPLDSAQLGDMYDVYAETSQGLVEAIYAYMYTPNIRELVAEYAEADVEASRAFKVFAAEVENGKGSNVEAARRHQLARLDRDQKRAALASALYQRGAPQSMDADSLAYLSQWLYRRGANQNEMLTALSTIIHTCALTFRSIGTQYDDLAYSQGLR